MRLHIFDNPGVACTHIYTSNVTWKYIVVSTKNKCIKNFTEKMASGNNNLIFSEHVLTWISQLLLHIKLPSFKCAFIRSK